MKYGTCKISSSSSNLQLQYSHHLEELNLSRTSRILTAMRRISGTMQISIQAARMNVPPPKLVNPSDLKSIVNSWTASKLTGTNRGLLIRSQIIKTIPQFYLRSMAVSIQVKGRLFGNSMFWIFTRASENIETGKPVCILKKMPDSQRVFCIFG